MFIKILFECSICQFYASPKTKAYIIRGNEDLYDFPRLGDYIKGFGFVKFMKILSHNQHLSDISLIYIKLEQ